MAEEKGKEIVNLENSRTAEQTAHMQAVINKGECGFCHVDRSLNPVDLFGNAGWWVRENAWPYDGLAWHFVIPAVKHLTKLCEIDEMTACYAHEAIMWVLRNLPILGGAIVLRFGEFICHAGTYKHLHFQMQVSNLLSQAFVTIGKPDAMQIQSAVNMLLRVEAYKERWDTISKEEYWQVLRSIRSESVRPFVKDHFQLRTMKPFDIHNRTGFVELIKTVQRLERDFALPGAALVLRFGDPRFHGRERENLIADVVVADGTGPVFEVLHPAFNEAQAMRSMGTLVKKQ